MQRLRQRIPMVIFVLGLGLLLARCGSAAEERGAPLRQSADAVASATSQTVSTSNPEEAQMAPTQPPAPDAPQPSQPGEVASGAPSLTPDSPAPPTPQAQLDPAAWDWYIDRSQHFRIAYPPAYAVKLLSDAERAQLSPTPLAAVYFQDQRPGSGLGAPALTVLTFANDARQPLEDWLAAAGLLRRDAGWVVEPYRSGHASGLKVSTATLMAPGVFIYIAREGVVYQLTPLGDEAERMLETFMPT